MLTSSTAVRLAKRVRRLMSSPQSQAPGSRRLRPLGVVESLEERWVPATFIVNSLADNGFGSGNTGDLRYVLNRANTLNTGTIATPDVIQFSGVTISQSSHTIFVGTGAAGAKPLPAITDKMIIDGTTALGFSNTTTVLVTLDGSSLPKGSSGLTLQGGYSTVKGLEITNFSGNGISITSGNNTIGGNTVGIANGTRNNPTGRITVLGNSSPPVTPAFVRPPDGNVINKNGGDGISIVGGSGNNTIEGNFIGTDIKGTTAKGNRGNGITILSSDNNMVWGTTPIDKDNPFVYYNVISGNKGNGIVVDNSDNTTLYANFVGLGADNNTSVGNALDGVVIKGDSDTTYFGGNIPLGNVVAANGRDGIVVTDSASRTLIGNAFDGVAAFNNTPHPGNGRNGMLINSTGGGKYFGTSLYSTIVLTCLVSGNGRDGIEISGRAANVQVTSSLIGMQTNGNVTEPNGRNGIEITDNAMNISIGGYEPSVAGVPQNGGNNTGFVEAANLISGNAWNGISISGSATNVRVVNSQIGTKTDRLNPQAAPNGRSGILIDGVSNVQVGVPLGSTNNTQKPTANLIAFNGRYGVEVTGGKNNSVLGSSIFENVRTGIYLAPDANLNQPSPVLTAVIKGPNGSATVNGTLTAQSNTTYQVEIYASNSNKPGNGKFFLGFLNVTTNASGFATFSLNVTNPKPGEAIYYTATATSPAGSTSQFSPPKTA